MGYYVSKPICDKHPASKLANLQGQWRMVSMQLGNDAVPPQVVGNSRLVVRGHTWRLQFRQQTTSYVFCADPAKGHLDVNWQSAGRQRIIRCLFDWDGKRLVVCRSFKNSECRPKKIAAAEGIGVSVWERELI